MNPAASLWKQVMEKVHADLPDKSFDRPSSGLTTVTVCADSGKLCTDACLADPRGSRAVSYEVAAGTGPTEECTLHKMVDICTEGNCLAGEFCPAESIVQQGYLDYVREDYGESITRLGRRLPDLHPGGGGGPHRDQSRRLPRPHGGGTIVVDPNDPDQPMDPNDPDWPFIDHDDPTTPEDPNGGTTAPPDGETPSGGNTDQPSQSDPLCLRRKWRQHRRRLVERLLGRQRRHLTPRRTSGCAYNVSRAARQLPGRSRLSGPEDDAAGIRRKRAADEQSVGKRGKTAAGIYRKSP